MAKENKLFIIYILNIGSYLIKILLFQELTFMSQVAPDISLIRMTRRWFNPRHDEI